MHIIAALVTLNLLVILHELGHYLAARAGGMAVPEFGIGFGPRLAGVRVGQTDFVLRLLPLGGYVLLPDLGGGAPAGPGVGPRAWAMAAGPAANLLLAVLLLGPGLAWQMAAAFYGALAGLLTGGGQQAEVMGIVGIVQETSRAAAMGWEALRFVAGALSMSLALINLLPFPGLDGGRLVSLAIERLRGGRRPAWEPALQTGGLLLLLGLGLWLAGRELWQIVA